MHSSSRVYVREKKKSLSALVWKLYMADNDTFRYLGGLGLKGFLAYMCDWVCTTWEETGPELADLELSWAVLAVPGGPFFGSFLGSFLGSFFGSFLVHFWLPKWPPKRTQNRSKTRLFRGLFLDLFFGRFWSSLGTFREPSWVS